LIFDLDFNLGFIVLDPLLVRKLKLIINVLPVKPGHYRKTDNIV